MVARGLDQLVVALEMALRATRGAVGKGAEAAVFKIFCAHRAKRSTNGQTPGACHVSDISHARRWAEPDKIWTGWEKVFWGQASFTSNCCYRGRGRESKKIVHWRERGRRIA